MREDSKVKYICKICEGRSCELKNVKQHLKTKKHKDALDQINVLHKFIEVSHHHTEDSNDLNNWDTVDFVQAIHHDQIAEVPPMLQLGIHDIFGFGNDGEASENERDIFLEWKSLFLDSLSSSAMGPRNEITRDDESNSSDDLISDISWYPFPRKEVSTHFSYHSSRLN